MQLPALGTFLLLSAVLLSGCASKRPVPEERPEQPSTSPTPLAEEKGKHLAQAVAPKEFRRIPPPDAAAAKVPEGYRVEVVVRDLVYPTAIAFDDQGNLYVSEAGYAYGDLVAPARVLRVSQRGELQFVADQLNGPVTDLLWHQGRLYISHRGKISVLEQDTVRDLVTGLPSFGDHHNNQMAIGPDGKLYFGQGTATNSGVVGLDNVFPYLWLTFWPDVHDLSPYPLELEDVTYTTPDALTVLARSGELVHTARAVERLLSPGEPLLVRTGPFQPFGKVASNVEGTVKAGGTILRMNPDGSGLEVFAWGLRNPFGVRFASDGRLFVSENSFDERGSRPIANAPDSVWVVKQGAWYGWPDFAAGEPVTDPKFKSARGVAPKFLLKKHPPVEKPAFTRPPHVAVTKFDFSRSARFGFAGQMFLGEIGTGAPVTTPGQEPAGYQVLTVDLETGKTAPFFTLREEARGPRGYEYAATPGPKRPVDVRFSPDGEALYVVDFGAFAAFPAGAGPSIRTFPGSGAIWRITREGSRPAQPPPNLSPLPGGGSRQGQ